MSFLDDYEPVEDRLRAFWTDHPAGRIVTVQVDAPEGEYIFRVGIYRTEDADEAKPAATGWAHEAVAQLPTNMKSSALEVCETSAIGRALANLGYAPKGKRPSREEMSASSGAVPARQVSGERLPAPGTTSGEGHVGVDSDPIPTTPSEGGSTGEATAYGEGVASAEGPPSDSTAPTWDELVALAGSVAAAREALNAASSMTYTARNVRNATDLERAAAREHLAKASV